MASNRDQCALDERGNLKDAKDIVWHHSESEDTPIGASNKGMIVISLVESQTLTILVSRYCIPASYPAKSGTKNEGFDCCGSARRVWQC